MRIETLEGGARRIWGEFPAAHVRHGETGFSAVIRWDEYAGLVGRARSVYGARYPDTGAAVIAAAWQARDNLARKLFPADDVDAAERRAEFTNRAGVVCLVAGIRSGEYAVTFVSAYTLEGDR